MSNPTTFRAEPGSHGFDWNEPATLHRAGDGGGVFHEMKGIRHGTLGELVRQVLSLPESDQRDYAIAKAGDHRLGIDEIRALATRADYPGNTGLG